MMLTELIKLEAIEIKDNVDSKEDLVKNLVNLLSENTNLIDKDIAIQDVLNRENVMSTGVGKSIALPHAKTDAVKGNIGSIILLKEPVEYNSIDDEPVKLSFLLLSQKNNIGVHLKLLSQISRLLNNNSLRNQIFECNKPEEIYEVLLKFDKGNSENENKNIHN